MKARLLNDRVTFNLAAFHEEFTNFQVLEFTGTAFQTFNVPEALTSGVELETAIRPSDNLTINGGLTVFDARYPDDCGQGSDVAIVLSLCGNDLTNAPNVVGIMGATYEADLTDTLDFFLSGQVRMESDSRTSTQAIVPPGAAEIAAAGSVQAAIDAAPLIVGDIQDGNIMINLRAGFGSIERRVPGGILRQQSDRRSGARGDVQHHVAWQRSGQFAVRLHSRAADIWRGGAHQVLDCADSGKRGAVHHAGVPPPVFADPVLPPRLPHGNILSAIAVPPLVSRACN